MPWSWVSWTPSPASLVVLQYSPFWGIWLLKQVNLLKTSLLVALVLLLFLTPKPSRNSQSHLRFFSFGHDVYWRIDRFYWFLLKIAAVLCVIFLDDDHSWPGHIGITEWWCHNDHPRFNTQNTAMDHNHSRLCPWILNWTGLHHAGMYLHISARIVIIISFWGVGRSFCPRRHRLFCGWFYLLRLDHHGDSWDLLDLRLASTATRKIHCK